MNIKEKGSSLPDYVKAHKDEILKIASWILVVLSLSGNMLINFKMVSGMWVWTFADMGFIIYTLVKREFALMTLNVVFTIFNIIGIIMWSK